MQRYFSEDEKERLTSKLIDLCKYVNQEVHTLIPYSSNRPSTVKQPAHRLFWLNTMRAPNDRNKTRQNILKQIEINLTYPVCDDIKFKNHQFTKSKAWLPKGINTAGELDDYLFNLHESIPRKKLHKNGSRYSTFHHNENRAKNAVKFGIGNCDEMAALAFVLLLEYPQYRLPTPDTRLLLEIVYLEEGDHVFLLVNRDPQTQLNDIDSWNMDTIVLDPWMNEVFVVGDENTMKQSSWYRWVQKHEKYITSNHNDYGYIAEGHSSHWLKNRTRKDQPLNLGDWEPYRNRFYKK